MGVFGANFGANWQKSSGEVLKLFKPINAYIGMEDVTAYIYRGAVNVYVDHDPIEVEIDGQ